MTAIVWVIAIGAQTGPGTTRPDPAWVSQILHAYRQTDVPVFLKNNLLWPRKIQEWPTAAQQPVQAHCQSAAATRGA